MSDGKWAQRLRDFQQNPGRGTAKTDERGVSSVSSVGGEGVPRKNEGQNCDGRRHMSPDRRCLEPVVAGLADKALPPWRDLMNGHGRQGQAFESKEVNP